MNLFLNAIDLTEEFKAQLAVDGLEKRKKMNQKTIRIGYFEEIKTVFSFEAEGNLEQEYPNVMKSLQNTDYTMYQN